MSRTGEAAWPASATTIPNTNLCQAIRVTQGKGLMPDGTSRFSLEGKPLLHYMGCSTFANFTVLPEIALAKVREDAPFDKIRSEERRVGKECVRPCRSRWSPYH